MFVYSGKLKHAIIKQTFHSPSLYSQTQLPRRRSGSREEITHHVQPRETHLLSRPIRGSRNVVADHSRGLGRSWLHTTQFDAPFPPHQIAGAKYGSHANDCTHNPGNKSRGWHAWARLTTLLLPWSFQNSHGADLPRLETSCLKRRVHACGAELQVGGHVVCLGGAGGRDLDVNLDRCSHKAAKGASDRGDILDNDARKIDIGGIGDCLNDSRLLACIKLLNGIGEQELHLDSVGRAFRALAHGGRWLSPAWQADAREASDRVRAGC
eukprot:1503517-Rhodomonas_salina.3